MSTRTKVILAAIALYLYTRRSSPASSPAPPNLGNTGPKLDRNYYLPGAALELQPQLIITEAQARLRRVLP